MSSDGLAAPLTKSEQRQQRAEFQRVDAAKVRSEMEAAKVAQDAKTIRLRALRLAKEAVDREAALAVVKKPRAKRALKAS